jgi:ribosomal protein S27E
MPVVFSSASKPKPMIKTCLDCGAEIGLRKTRCLDCAVEQVKLTKKSKAIKRCADCGAVIGAKRLRCIPCSVDHAEKEQNARRKARRVEQRRVAKSP